MKIAYLSVQRDGTGYANSARDFIKCLLKEGVDIVPVWFTLNDNPYFIDTDIPYRNDLNGVDIVIQQTIPNSFIKVTSAKNIGMFYWETSNFSSSGWQHSCNLMDEIWMTTPEQATAAKESGVSTAIQEVSRPCDFAKYDKSYTPIKFPDSIKDTYKFYTISDFSHRKNVTSLIACFLSEFTIHDNVSLILRTYISNKSSQDSMIHISKVIEEIKSKLKKPTFIYPKILVITDHQTDDTIMSLHKQCDCFVSMSRGEGECIPAFDAASFSKPCIITRWNGPAKMFMPNYRSTINSMVKKSVFGMSESSILPGLYSSSEWWMEGSSYEFMEKMRLARNGEFADDVEKQKEFLLNTFSYSVVGPKLKELLSK